MAYSLLVDQATARDQLVQAGGGEPQHVDQLHDMLGLNYGGLAAYEDEVDPAGTISRGDMATITSLRAFADRANEVLR